MILDVYIEETLNGGDAILRGRDVVLVSGWENMLYLGMFGGNVEQSTTTRREGEQSFDWWGNSLFFPEEPSIQFNSLTERRLKEVALNSSGRELIEQAAKKDLAFMKPFADVKVTALITGPDRVEIRITVKKPDQLEGQVYIYLWDGLESTLRLLNPNPNNGGDFSDDFNNDFSI